MIGILSKSGIFDRTTLYALLSNEVVNFFNKKGFACNKKQITYIKEQQETLEHFGCFNYFSSTMQNLPLQVLPNFAYLIVITNLLNMKFFTFILLLFLSTTILGQVPCNSNDSLALVRLGSQLQSSGSPITNTIWNSTLTVSQWQGISTVQVGQELRVDSILLGGRALTGILESSLFDGDSLSSVKHLDLSNNNIGFVNGSLVTFGKTNSSLESIDVSNNDFDSFNSGNFLTELLTNFTDIKYLNAKDALDNISLISFLNFPTSNTLKVLLLDNNSINYTIDLEAIINTNFPVLEELSLSSNSITISNITTTNTFLKVLNVSNNMLSNFSNIDNVLSQCTSLEILQANNALDIGSVLQVTIPVGGFTNLRELHLASNDLTGTIPIGLLEEIPNLEVLDLSNNLLGGILPTPTNTISFSANSIGAYGGLSAIKRIDFSNNQLDGKLNLIWLLGQQIRNNATTPTALESFDMSNNDFDEITPKLENRAVGRMRVAAAFRTRFANLQYVDVSDNALDFADLYRLTELMHFNRAIRLTNPNVSDYIPQAGLDSADFQYDGQDSVGIGGVKRRNQGGSMTFEAGRVPREEEDDGNGNIAINTTGPLYCNVYSWETFDQQGTVSTLGTVVLGNYIGGGGPTYRPGGQAAGNFGNIDINNMHTLGIVNADTAIHNNRSYAACVTNDSFPNLTLCMKQKKVEIGSCVDSSGNPVQCQTMIVQFKPSVLAGLNQQQQDSVKRAAREALGAKPIDECLCGDIELWEVSDTAMVEGKGQGTKRNSSRARSRPELQSADPDYALMGDSTNNLPDTLAIQQGQGNTTATTLVAIIDSGVDYDYTGLQPFISEGAIDGDTCMPDAAWGYNFLDRNNNANDDHGHGTAIAGIVTGLSQRNLIPYTSSSPDIGILPLKYTDKEGKGTLFNATCALHYAARYKRVTPSGDTARVRVVNCSWGYYGDPCMVLENAIDYVGQQNCGILIVASAGNDTLQVQGDPSRAHWPSNSLTTEINTNVDNILSVAAITAANSQTLAPYSNYGNIKIDMTAQGTDITTRAGTTNGVGAVNGTSFAAAQVSRAAALLFDKYPESSYFAVKFALMNGTDSLESADANKILSKGKLNYQKADSLMNIIIDRAECTESGIMLNVNEINGAEEHLVQIYPNPVQQELIVNIDYQLNQKDKINLNLYNAQGQLIQYQTLGTGELTASFDVNAIPVGIYFLQVQVGDKQWTKKIIKQ